MTATRMCSALLKSGAGKEAEAVLWKKKEKRGES